MTSLGFLARNPGFAAREPRLTWAAIKAMREYRKARPHCEWCERLGSDVHHELPVHRYPEFADKPSNFCTMCRRCHLAVGHCNDWRDYNPGLRPAIAIVQRARLALVMGRDA